jgi:fluoroacetyl-CoA thioesterase
MTTTTHGSRTGRDERPQLAPGSSAVLTHQVRAEDSATAWGNELDVLATPVLLWLSEIAAMQAVSGDVPSGWMTLGARHDSTHAAPTGIGETVTVRATLASVDGRNLVFDVEARDSRGTILHGRHHRGLVRTTAFRAKHGI